MWLLSLAEVFCQPIMENGVRNYSEMRKSTGCFPGRAGWGVEWEREHQGSKLGQPTLASHIWVMWACGSCSF